MSKPITRYASLEPQDKLTADILHKFLGEGSWQLFDDDDIPNTIFSSDSLQIRDKNAIAKPADVAKLSLAYQRKQPVPAVVVTLDGSAGTPRLVIDGYTRAAGRLQACKVMKWEPTIRQFVVNVDPDRMDDGLRGTLMMIGIALNQKHGTTMTLRNVAAVLAIAAPGESTLSARTIAERCNISQSTVDRVRALQAAEDRAEKLGISLTYEDRTMGDSALVILGQKNEKISNRVFGEVVKLTLQANLSNTEMQLLFREILSSYDDTGRMATIRRWQAENRERIAGRASRPTEGRRLQLLLGQLDRIDVDAMVEREDPGLFEGNLKRLQDGARKFDEAIKIQLQVQGARGPITVPFK